VINHHITTKLIMKKILVQSVVALAAFTAINSHAQGALTPTGAPAPMMKSLDQVEARTAITNTSSTATISQPGSYYLTGNLTVSTGSGILITTNGVTLDLNGFTIRSTVASPTGAGILLSSGLSDITIGNGHIRGGVTNNGSGVYSGSGFNYGINYSSIQPVNMLVSRLSVSGCQFYGIYLGTGDSTVVEACTVRTLGNYGIKAAIVKNCTAVDCGLNAIECDQASDSRGECSNNFIGLYANIAQNCYGSSNSGTGINATDVAIGCRGVSISGTGLSAFIASSCRGTSTSGTGLVVTHNANSF
jgi:hypothetical protein